MNDVTDVFQPLQAGDPSVVAGYRLAARLGAGGMGRVYLAHTQGGRPVAIKVVRPELADDPDFRRRFGREIRAAQRVRGAYTAELIDADADAVPPWLATLYVPGPSLAEAVARRGPLSVTAVLWLMAGMAEALQAIHAEGIVHRDLKPSNVLLAADGPRVIDFGIALAADATSYTATGHTVGTPAYMAPEQASGEEVTAATDVFALAQTAAFAALGRPLYGDGAGVYVLYRIVHSGPDLSLLPEPLRPLFARCLAADPAERATPAEVVQWCRQRLGTDADEGGAPSVWREISGPEVAVPPPVPEPTPAQPQPLIGFSQRPTGLLRPTQAQAQDRRRRIARMVIVGSAAGALLLTALAWRVLDAEGRGDRRDTAGSSASSTGPEARSSDSAREPSSDSPDSPNSADSAAPGAGEQAAGISPSSPASPREPRPEPYPLIMLDAKNSVNLKNPDAEAKGRTGDIRFGCPSIGCQLESDTSVFLQLYGKPGGTLDECRRLLKHGKNHRLPLAGAANGSEICIKGPSGDIALFVISTKSTAMPDIAFLQGALTIWRGAA
ncbi:serine/threonine-protein kinase [Streptomyces sp. IB2014 016-6]|uniref:serine/threonine-protein kinase n=1 Tax=Streptomyces sp. IB2014 016-6 TaxID=2517818 RepID=UPI0011CA729D|nr:serine/threonine-protein kinase [Streptomyces sp. IB2014 016-6]TXL91810.1 serine/threonine protein kinase [Streptomyces sp. IB2014 016-6]